MKKLISILMMVSLVFSLCTTSFAAEKNGSITITNATIDETYNVYKILDANPVFSADGETTEGVTYSIEKNNQFFEPLFGADGTTNNSFFTYRANTGTVEKNKNVNDSELVAYLTNLVEDGTYTPAVASIVASGKTVKFDNSQIFQLVYA